MDVTLPILFRAKHLKINASSLPSSFRFAKRSFDKDCLPPDDDDDDDDASDPIAQTNPAVSRRNSVSASADNDDDCGALESYLE